MHYIFTKCVVSYTHLWDSMKLVVPVIYAFSGVCLHCSFFGVLIWHGLGISLFAGVLNILFQSTLLLVVGVKECNDRSF